MHDCSVCNQPSADCASSIYEKGGNWYVEGHYGSRLFDMNRLRFTGKVFGGCLERPINNPGPACDVCIQQWLNCGVVELDAEMGPMGEYVRDARD
jgi:hypothetical protein